MNKKRVVLFLGAGASKPMGYKTTAGMYEYINTETDSNELSPMDNTSTIGNSDTLIKDDILWNAIINSSQIVLDIEQILHILKNIIIEYNNHNSLFGSLQVIQDFLKNDYGIIINQKDFGTLDAFIQNTITLRDKIKRKILEQYSVAPNQNKTKYMKQFIMRLMNHVEDLSIFTTNYDPVLSEISNSLRTIYHFNDGFNKREQFEPSYESPLSNKPIIVCGQLHGSTGWKKIGEDKNAIIRKNSRPDFSLPDNKLVEKQLMIFPTFYSKKDDYIGRPYNYYFSKFKTKMEQADICIVIGCSFRDEILLKYFQEFLDYDNKLLLIVDKIDGEYYEFNQPFQQYQHQLKNSKTRIKINDIKANNVFLQGIGGQSNDKLFMMFSEWFKNCCGIDLGI